MTEYSLEFNTNLSFAGSLSTKLTTVEELLDTLPLSTEIRNWLSNHTEVRDALKVIDKTRFVPVGAISVVDNPLLNGVKQSIGIFSIDKRAGNMIKQDYLMHHDNNDFFLFTGINRRKFNESTYVKHVKRLEETYGPDGKNFFNNHHPNLEDIDPAISALIKEILRLLEQP